jgi:hypothetical protein
MKKNKSIDANGKYIILPLENDSDVIFFNKWQNGSINNNYLLS